MNNRLMWLAVVLLALSGVVADSRPVHVLDVKGMIEPAVANYIIRGIARAEDESAEAVLIKLDTPGGLYEPMREIVQAMLNSRVPVIVYVGPNGARAASAGTFITLAAHVAAMAPVTNIGSAHPVAVSPIPSGDAEGGDNTMMQKVVNDAAKYIVTIAQKRGRNAEWAEKAVRESANITAEEAVNLKVVDFVADNMEELLGKADGKTVETESGKVTLKTRGAPIREFPMKWYTLLLQYLANPLVAFFLMLIAIYGIIFEISTPGVTVPGVIAGVAVILLLYSFSVLPVNVAGIILILVAIGLFIAEIMVISHGALSLGGIIAFFVGSLMLFGSGVPGVAVPVAVILAGTLATAAVFVLLLGWGVKALRRPVVTGAQGMIGRVVVARTDIAPVGKIFTEGTWWTAETEGEAIRQGERAKIVGMEGLKVKLVKEEAM
ncbi:MAG: nodulation protein NfeD [Armatimonadetes bacterium]|nr:nodulation protein NfeD [Armatimonadota bacterium]